jgi:hypothetical protein
MKNKLQLNASVPQLEHRGGKKLAQLSTEFSHKKRDVRNHRTGAARSK